jgi:hypothetical protein
MPVKWYVPQDLNQLEIRRPVVHLLASPPGTPVEGQLYYDTASHSLFFYNGTTWVSTAPVPDTGDLTKFSATIGDGVATSIAVTHSISQDVISQVRDAATNLVVECDITNTSASVTTFTFSVAPALNSFRVVIIG